MKRRMVNRRVDRRYFVKTAKKTKAVNVTPTTGRGGIIM